MFGMTREDTINTLTEYGYSVEDRGSLLSVFTDDSQFVAEFRLIDDVVMRVTYRPAWGPHVRPDEVMELLRSDADHTPAPLVS